MNRDLSVAFFLPAYAGGGAERVALSWAEELQSSGHKVTFIHYLVQGGPPGFPHLNFPRTSTTRRWLRLSSWLRKVLRDESFDVVVSFLTFSNIQLLLATRRLRPKPATVISERNLLTLWAAHEPASGKLQRWLARRCYKGADAVAAISHPVAADLLNYGVDPDRLFVVPNPVGDERWAATARLPEHITRSLSTTSGSGGEELTVLFVGRLVTQKRPELLLESMLSLRRSGRPCRAVLVGDGPLRSELESAFASEGLTANFLGWETDWREHAATADVLLLPSDVEGFGNVLVEAAVAGLPAVAPSQALGVADAIVPGVTGVFAHSQAPDDLAAAVVDAAKLGRVKPPTGWLQWYGRSNSTERLLRVIRLAITTTSAPVKGR